jgi:general secretion pathway protein H
MSVTGRKSSPTLATVSRRAGFTLIEMLVVVLIIGLLAAGALITFGGGNRDTQLERELERVNALLDYVREQAELQTREFGLRIDAGGYQFVVFDTLTAQWAAAEADDALRHRTLPAGLLQRLVVEGRTVVVGPRKEIEEFAPQVLLYSSGDVSSFEFILEREGGGPSGRVYSDENGLLKLELPGQAEAEAAAAAATP